MKPLVDAEVKCQLCASPNNSSECESTLSSTTLLKLPNHRRLYSQTFEFPAHPSRTLPSLNQGENW